VRQALEGGSAVAILTRSPQLTLPNGVVGIGGGLGDPDWAGIEAFAPQTCIHCAWVATPGVYLTSIENFDLADQTLSFAEGLIDRNLEKFIGLGTCLEYKPCDQPLHEHSARSDEPFPYTQSKLTVCERLSDLIADRFAWLRIFYAYGPGEHEARFISSAIRTLLRGETLHIRRPEDLVDYIHVEDIASAALTTARTPAVGHFNVGSGKPRSVRDVATLIAEYCKRPDFVTFADSGNPSSRIADLARLREIGWEPRTHFETAIHAMCRTMSSNLHL
jgi:nucleoside-diphosphate-sugar epimerase